MTTRKLTLALILAATVFAGCDGQGHGSAGNDVSPAALYQQHCAACHGEAGQGTATGSGLSNLSTRFGTVTLTDIVLRGTGTMPGTPSLSDEEAAAIVSYLQSTFGPAE